MEEIMKPIQRITFLINRISASGGAERVMTVLANQFVMRGIDTTIITRQETDCVYPLDSRVKVLSTAVSCSSSSSVAGCKKMVRTVECSCRC